VLPGGHVQKYKIIPIHTKDVHAAVLFKKHRL
jgi:hypothetical protein